MKSISFMDLYGHINLEGHISA